MHPTKSASWQSRMEYYTFKKVMLGGVSVIFSITGYTGAGGCEIYAANEDADKLWDAVFEAGAEFGIKPIGLGARDTLRLEMGFCLYGNDIDDTTSPLEAGLGWITKFTDTKGDFIARASSASWWASSLSTAVFPVTAMRSATLRATPSVT